MADEALAGVWLAAARFVWYVGALGVIGTSAFRLVVAPAARRAASDLHRAAATAGLLSALLLTAAQLARLHSQTYALFGLDEPVTPALLLEVASDLPPWSTGWLRQLGAALFALIGLAAARAGLLAGWGAVHLAALAIAATLPLTGHAVAQEGWPVTPLVLQTGHVLGAGIWVGGLAVLLAVGVRPILRQPAPDHDAVIALVAAFSPMALTGAGLLAATGVLTSTIYLDEIASLWSTPYGRMLLAKVALFGAVAAAGYVNWRSVRPRLGDPGAADLLRRTAGVELAVAVAVLGVTAVLVGLAQPGE